jgi:hypothetical protein
LHPKFYSPIFFWDVESSSNYAEKLKLTGIAATTLVAVTLRQNLNHIIHIVSLGITVSCRSSLLLLDFVPYQHFIILHTIINFLTFSIDTKLNTKMGSSPEQLHPDCFHRLHSKLTCGAMDRMPVS